MDDYDSILGPSDTSPNIHPQVASSMDDFRNEIAKYATPKPTAPAPAPTLTPAQAYADNPMMRSFTNPASASINPMNAFGGQTTESPIASYGQAAVTHPIETVKGLIKGIPGQAAALDKAIEPIGKGVLSAVSSGVQALTGKPTAQPQGLDYGPIESLTTPSNKAQEVGYQTAGLLPFERAGPALSATKDIAESVIPKVAEGVSTTGNVLKDMATEGYQNYGAPLVENAKNILSKLNPLITKTPEEIMATPVDKLGKLSDIDKQYYFTQKSDQLATEHTIAQTDIQNSLADVTKKLQIDSDKKSSSLLSDATNLSNDVNNKTWEEAQSLKPQVISKMKEAGDQYVSLVDKEMPPEVASSQVTKQEIASSIRSLVPVGDLAASEAAERDILFINKSLPESGSTVKDLYDTMKKIRQSDISKAGTQGTKVLTGTEMEATKAISQIVNFLKNERGVDLSGANKFWSTYSPKRSMLMKVVQPRTQEGLESSTFQTLADNIRASIGGTNKPGTQKLLEQIQNFTGTKIGSPEVRNALLNLNKNKMEQIAVEAEKESAIEKATSDSGLKIIENKEKLTDAQKQLEILKLQTNQIARRRAWFKGIATTAIGATAADLLYKSSI